MALGSKPKLSEVYDEFHPLNRSKSMRWMWEKIFGTPSSGGKLSDFAGIGKPVVTKTGSSADTDSITANINVTKNGLTTYVRLRANPTSDPSTVITGNWSAKADGAGTVSLGGLDDNTEYSYRIQYYNAFGTSSYYEQTSAYSEITDQATLFAPTLDSVSNSGINFTINWSMSPPVADSLSIEYERNNNGVWLANSVTITNFNNSSTPFSVTFWTNNLPTTGDYYSFRAKAVKSGYNTSVYSNEIGIIIF